MFDLLERLDLNQMGYYEIAEEIGGDLTERLFLLADFEHDLRRRRAIAAMEEAEGRLDHRLLNYCRSCGRPHDKHERRPADEQD